MRYIFILLFVLITSNAIAAPAEPELSMPGSEEEIPKWEYLETKVTTPSRFPKPLKWVAENITVITAKDIEEMHAHTVADVLKWVPGVFVDSTQDFGAYSLLSIQGSEPQHVLVLLDGMEWNYGTDGNAETGTIPVGIIGRIEIIKGPASSSWGSALGGVINIITKDTMGVYKPEGYLAASRGERGTGDYNGYVGGSKGKLEYSLFADKKESGGLVKSRGFDSSSIYTKMQYVFGGGVTAGVSLGYTDLGNDFGDFPSAGVANDWDENAFFANAFFKSRMTENVELDIKLHALNKNYEQDSKTLGMGSPYLNTDTDDEQFGGSVNLNWSRGLRSLNVGGDFNHGSLRQSLVAGTFLQSIGAPEESRSSPAMDEWSVYANATIPLGNFSISPGLRYDYNDITGGFVSPSIGATWVINNTVFRASVARGFTVPGLSITEAGGLFLSPNPDLDPERVWSYQVGVESSAVKYLRIKANLFYYDLEDAHTIINMGAGAATYDRIFINSDGVDRKGVEFEFETLPVNGFSLASGFSFTDIDPENNSGASDVYSATLKARYLHNDMALLATGYYMWWDSPDGEAVNSDDSIWDLSITKAFKGLNNKKIEVFVVAHNIFNGDQPSQNSSVNPARWVEAGVKFSF